MGDFEEIEKFEGETLELIKAILKTFWYVFLWPTIEKGLGGYQTK